MALAHPRGSILLVGRDVLAWSGTWTVELLVANYVSAENGNTKVRFSKAEM
jgi:hypothetical protein